MTPYSKVEGAMSAPELPEPKSVFLDTGEQVYEYFGSDFGIQPDWSKEELEGQGLIIRGLSEETFKGDFDIPARSVLYNVIDDPEGTEPWGMFFSEGSPVIQQVQRQLAKGRVPFIATIRSKKSESHKGQSYWTLERWVRNVTEEGKK
jgi:hypothetical protein